MDFHWEYEKIIGSVINDPLTILLERNPDLFLGRVYHAECVCDGSARGMLMVDAMDFMKKEKNVIIYEDIEVFEVWRDFIELITGEEVDIDVLGGLL